MKASASASGKVLITGGYLILEQPYHGITMSMSARFHASVISRDTSSSELDVNLQEAVPLIVHAPQRHPTPLVYGFSQTSHSIMEINAESKSNPFVLLTLQYVFLVADQLLGTERLNELLKLGLNVHLHGDRPFYSAGGRNYSNITGSDAKSDLDDEVKVETSKTGLGSSACLVRVLSLSCLQSDLL
jgi:phosphomevalonate kinase